MPERLCHTTSSDGIFQIVTWTYDVMLQLCNDTAGYSKWSLVSRHPLFGLTLVIIPFSDL